MTTRLTEEQIGQSDLADSCGETFANVTPDQLFGKSANGVLAQTVYRTNPRAYREKRSEFEMQVGVTPRPMEFWHRLPSK